MSHQPWTLVGQFASVRFSVTADASPGLLPRLLQAFAKRDLVPDLFDARRAGEGVRVEIGMRAMPAEIVHLVQGNMQQVVGVHSVTRQAEITGVVRRSAA